MSLERDVASHYTSGNLLQRIRQGLAQMGRDPDQPALDDLKAVDEFHIGGVEATRALLARMAVGAGDHLLDIGSGLGGPARFIADTTGCRVTGIDLTEEFVETARALSAMTGLAERTDFVHGSALDLPFEAATFDAATLLHVGMNILDKARLFAEAARVLRPGGVFAVYDVMHVGPGEIDHPVPWSETAENDFSADPGTYLAAAEAAGFAVSEPKAHRERALAHFELRRAEFMAAGGPPPLGVHLLTGATGREKMANMQASIVAGKIAPVEMICRLPG